MSLLQTSRGLALGTDKSRQTKQRHNVSSIGPGTDLMGSWRQAHLLQKRLRTDGIYIARCGYKRRVALGESMTDTRQAMSITYYRLIRVLPELHPHDPANQVLVLTYEGEPTHAVDALKTHPAGRLATFGPYSTSSEPSQQHSKIHERVRQGVYSFDLETMTATIKFVDGKVENHVELQLSHLRRNGSRQNYRLTWQRYEFTSLRMPEDSGTYNLQKEAHFAPYNFARVRALEHLF
eukprot:TRINITY_DN30158_c1_g4_i3.p1 TRINITY_DN30158_c1_g4~~TRINITY_DN30158_c1_g4_i3.p1  ORF type:complete len:236 (-),score=28.61 TRINITY_DN30158_c1_g4_i3:304-1011(-)